MKFLVILFSIFINTHSMVLFDFTSSSDLQNWNIVDDVVMGGRSDGYFGINESGNVLFAGKVSLENNGGFSSVRYRFQPLKVADYRKVAIRLKGDGKRYQFRVKSSINDRHSYIYYIETNGDWQLIEIPLSEMYPTFRGRLLDMPNYPGELMSEIAFLIGNKKPQSFQLELDKIVLE